MLANYAQIVRRSVLTTAAVGVVMIILSVVLSGIGREDRLPGNPRLVHSTLPDQESAQLSLCLRALRVELDGLSVLGKCVAGPARGLEAATEGGVEDRRLRIGAQRDL